MGLIVGMGSALSTPANTTTADQISGTYQNVGKGVVSFWAKASATGMYATLLVGGVALLQDKPIPFTGTSGTLSKVDNLIGSQMFGGGRIELYLRNSTGAALTTDYVVEIAPGR